MRHEQSHPTPVPGCFGCKVRGVGINHRYAASNGAFTQTKVAETSTGFVETTEHWNGRQDVNVHGPALEVPLIGG